MVSSADEEIIALVILKRLKQRQEYWMNALVREFMKYNLLEGKYQKVYHKVRRFLSKLAVHGYLKWRKDPYGINIPSYFELTDIGRKALLTELKELKERRKRLAMIP